MRYIVNSGEMQLYDKNTTEQFKIPSIVLMERAAAAAAEELCQRDIDLTHVLVVCGNGNNGGDGLAIARILKLAGYAVDIVLAGDREKVTEQNRLQQEILKAYGYEIDSAIPPQERYTAVVDAVFGVGLSRDVKGSYAALIRQMNAAVGEKIAIDIASGISADNGSILGMAFAADITITFAYEKTGMLLWPGNEYSGEIVVKDIGINERSFLNRKPAAACLEKKDLQRLKGRKSHSNKGTFGKLLVIAGCVDMAGAAVLCAKAAYAAGCGLVRVLTPEENRIIVQNGIPEAVLTTYPAEQLDPAALSNALDWADVIVCGPGIGTADTADQIVKTVIKTASVPVLFDADALNLIAQDTDILQCAHTTCVLTPHLGEMSRLRKETVADIQNQLLEVAEAFARQYNVICVLKDERTVTAVPCGQIWVNLSGNAGMATAGSGDVLSGVIGALMAQGMDAKDAAPYGVFLHGIAGDTIQKRTGKRGLTASDLIEGLKYAAAEIEEQKGMEV